MVISPSGRWNVVTASKTWHGGGVDVDVEQNTESVAVPIFSPVRFECTSNSKTVRIGQINAEGLIDEIWATSGSVEPDPYLETYEWGEEFAAEKPS